MSEETTPVEETVQETVEQQAEQKTEAAEESKTPDNVSVAEDGTIKIDLRNTKQESDAVQEQSTDEVSVRDGSETSGEVQEQNIEKTDEKPTGESQPDNNEDAVLERLPDEEEVKEEKSLADKIKDIPNKLKEEVEDVNNNQDTRQLPENVEKLVQFMEETGGSVQDYVNLNKNYDDMDDMQLLREYYHQTKPHLASDEVDFLIEDNFSFDEEVDEEKDIKRKKLMFKEAIADAKSNLSNLKNKYYEELKLGSKLTSDQKEAIDFFNNYKSEQESTQQLLEKQRNIFSEKTNQLFSNEFKGFEYKVGNNRYRFNVKDVDSVKSQQSDINKFVSKFVDSNNELNDARGYHKALFTAMNADAIANHFYEQGKADAIKDSMAKSKNIDMAARKTHEAVTTDSGIKIRAISGDDSSKLRVKIKN